MAIEPPLGGCIAVEIPPDLQHFAIHPGKYLQDHPQITNLAVGAFIFSSANPSAGDTRTSPRLLIIKRASAERGFPNKWEVPGGGTEIFDATIIRSLARETFEETGLRLTKVVREVGNAQEWGNKKGRWRKLNFEIEVATEQPSQNQVDSIEDETCSTNKMYQYPTVTLDPKEHQAFAWVTASELREKQYSITTSEQFELMLSVFANRGISEESPTPSNESNALNFLLKEK